MSEQTPKRELDRFCVAELVVRLGGLFWPKTVEKPSRALTITDKMTKPYNNSDIRLAVGKDPPSFGGRVVLPLPVMVLTLRQMVVFRKCRQRGTVGL